MGSSNESVAGAATITITARDPDGLTATASFGVAVSDGPGQSAQTSLNLVKAEVRTPGPDLVVVSPTASVGSLAAGAAFTLSARVRNTGGEASPPTTLRYYRSTDATITRSDTPLGTVAIDGLDAGRASRAEVTSATAPSSVGTYYYGACVDAVTDELDTTNNCSSSVTVRVP